MTIFLGIALGLGLSAACGFRIFIPMLVLSAAAQAGQVTLAPGFEWIGTEPALIVFSVAAVCEISAYLVPAVDNLLDVVATPAAVVAGTLLTASVVVDLSPLIRWTLALIAGGGVAGIVQTATVTTRAASTATSAGLGNQVVSKAEFIGSAALSFLAVLLPFAAVGAALVLFVYAVLRLIKKRFPSSENPK